MYLMLLNNLCAIISAWKLTHTLTRARARIVEQLGIISTLVGKLFNRTIH